jgi:hypothetical protein
MCAAATGCRWYKKHCFSYSNNDDGDDDDDNGNNNNNNNAYFIEQSPWEVHRFSASQEILRIVWSLWVQLLSLQEPVSYPCS